MSRKSLGVWRSGSVHRLCAVSSVGLAVRCGETTMSSVGLGVQCGETAGSRVKDVVKDVTGCSVWLDCCVQ